MCFFQESSKVCHLSLASTRLLLVVQRTTSQQEWLYTCIALRALKVSYSDVGEGGVAMNCEKTQFFMNTLYINSFSSLCLDRPFIITFLSAYKRFLPALRILDFAQTCPMFKNVLLTRIMTSMMQAQNNQHIILIVLRT